MSNIQTNIVSGLFEETKFGAFKDFLNLQIPGVSVKTIIFYLICLLKDKVSFSLMICLPI